MGRIKNVEDKPWAQTNLAVPRIMKQRLTLQLKMTDLKQWVSYCKFKMKTEYVLAKYSYIIYLETTSKTLNFVE